jgi:predicted DNA-binding antitoxin AbrB/MazE fold protein
MSLEATYEQGTLRLSQPITLEEGSKVQVIIIPLESNEQPKRTLEILKKIAELPLEGKIDTFGGKDHDQILYC